MSILPNESAAGFRLNQQRRSPGQDLGPRVSGVITPFPILSATQLPFPFLAAGVAAQKRGDFFVREFATVFAGIGFGNTGSFRELHQNKVVALLVSVRDRPVAVRRAGID